MKAIVAVDDQWGIGNKGELLFHISEDLKRFKEITTGKVVIMGRKTLESLPNGKPLPNRTNIILTTNKEYVVENGIVVHDIESLLQETSKYNTDDLFVIGGGSVYNELLPLCDTIYVTKIHAVKEADTFFPNLDEEVNFEWVFKEHRTDTEIPLDFMTYENRNLQ